jgi:hypothetical protein
LPRMHEDFPEMQHLTSDGPLQYPDTVVPLHALVCLQVPLPEGVLQGLFVQHLISDEPGHKPEFTDPLQQPAAIETHTPSIPPTLKLKLA